MVGLAAYFSGQRRLSRLPQPRQASSCRVRRHLSSGRLGSGPHGLLQRIVSAGLAACPTASPSHGLPILVAAPYRAASVMGLAAYYSG